jgi:hypothetical protein
MDDANYAKFVTANVEHREASYLIGAGIRPSKLGHRFPLGFIVCPKPAPQWTLGVPMHVPKGAQGFFGDDMHAL